MESDKLILGNEFETHVFQNYHHFWLSGALGFKQGI